MSSRCSTSAVTAMAQLCAQLGFLPSKMWVRMSDAYTPEAHVATLQARRVTAEGYVSRACAIGCSGMLTNEQVYAMTDCQPLIVRMAEFLVGMESDASGIAAKEAVRPALGVGSVQAGAVLLAVLPAGVLLAAFLVLRRRSAR